MVIEVLIVGTSCGDRRLHAATLRREPGGEDNQKPQEAKLAEAKRDDLRAPRPAATPTEFTATPTEFTAAPSHREVTATGNDEHGVVASLHSEWGMVSKDEAISDIEAGRASYAAVGGQPLVVVDGSTGKYLCSHTDGGNADNLDELPNPASVDPA